MRRSVIALLVVAVECAGVPAAQAQTPPQAAPPESVIVTAPRILPDKAIDDFVMSHATPTRSLDKIARWRDGICPNVRGLPQRSIDFVVRRIEQIAATVGAPVQAKIPCRPNIDVIFTTVPQKLLDSIRADQPSLLGADSPSHLKNIATVNHPIQAWYTTETEDLHGSRTTDDPSRIFGVQVGASTGAPPNTPGGDSMTGSVYLPYATYQNVEATRLGNGLSSDLYHAPVIVDPTRLAGIEMGELSDYIAMLTLSQAGSFDSCQDVASITNLMSPDCDAAGKSNAITDVDLAYLRGVYKMEPGGTLQQQRGEIVFQMKKSLEGR